MNSRLFPLLLLLSASLCLSSCARHSSSGNENILLIVLDAARADRFSSYGYGRETTPVLDRLADEGIRFTRAVSTSSWTIPSHASLFTGLFLYEHGMHGRHCWLLDRFTTLAELFQANGYATAAFSNNAYVSRENNLGQGFTFFESIWLDSEVVTERKPFNTDHTNKLVKSYLKRRGKEPFFVFINYMDTHRPYDPPEPYKSRFLPPGTEITARLDSACGDPNPLNNGEMVLSEDEKKLVSDISDGALSYLDDRIGDLLDFLKDEGLYDNTLVVVMSDHGELYGEYGYWAHGTLLKRPLVHVPLIMRLPGDEKAGTVRDEVVSLTDVYHTLAAFADPDRKPPGGPGRKNLLGDGIASEPALSEIKIPRMKTGKQYFSNDGAAVWKPDDRHYIHREDEQFECYDLAADFEEKSNLCPGEVSREQVEETVSSFTRQLVAFEEKPSDLRITESRSAVDPKTEQALKAIGYVDDSNDAADQKYEKEHKHVTEHVKTAVFWLRRGELDKAELNAKKGLFMSSGNMVGRKTLAQVNMYRGQFGEAAVIFEKLLPDIGRFPPMVFECRINLLKCYLELERRKKAVRIMKRLDKSMVADYRSFLFDLLAKLYDMGDVESVKRFVLELAAENRDNRDLLVTSAVFMNNREEWIEVEKICVYLAQLEPSPHNRMMLGIAHIKTRNIEAARTTFEGLLRDELTRKMRIDVQKILASIRTSGQ